MDSHDDSLKSASCDRLDAIPTSSAADSVLQSQRSTQEGPSTSTISDNLPNPRLEALAKKKANLEATLASLENEHAALVAQSPFCSGEASSEQLSDDERTKQALTGAQSVIKQHITLLHKYNELKDIGLGLMGLIADGRGVRVARVMEEFGISEKD